ncbi:hypothetical protein EIP86_011466 [Pleurotus ostreatoroseus]|nr:hypothetical protein EIP86_011466 [Pleurotus ostreatoroseus]
MIPTRILALLCAVVSVAGLSPRFSPHVRHESRRALPASWTPLRRADSDLVLPLRIGLVQPQLDDIERMLLDVSDPESPNYGNHWSAAKIATTFRASPEAVNTVKEWLVTEGVHPSKIRLTSAGNWIEANVTISEAEDLLKTEYYLYGHELSGTEHVACGSAYHLPEHVSKHVDLVTPTLHFDVKVKRRSSDPAKRSLTPSVKPGQPGFGPVVPKTTGTIKNIIDELENCDQHITPNCLRALYDFVYFPVATSKNSLGIVEYTPQSYIPGDLDMFFKNFSSSQVGQRPDLISIDGGQLVTDEFGFGVNGESDLDLQYSMALVGKSQPVTLYQTGDEEEGASFNNFLDALDGSFCTFEGGDSPIFDATYPDPFNSSISYEGPAACGTVKPAYVISTSYSYDEADLTPSYTARQCAEYAKLGLMGVTILYSSGDNGVAGNDGVCLTADGVQEFGGTIFNPGFPGTCPYITSVGATQVNPGAKVTDPESACQQVIFSGGGFSNNFKMPDYQKSAVESFLKNHPPSYATTIYNTTGSRAYPDISANGLFQGAFNDITNGTNPGCGTEGFSAVRGWDPVTGLGTPNFPQLLARWLILP